MPRSANLLKLFLQSTPKRKLERKRSKKALSFEQLELRRMLALYTFVTPSGGSWHDANNWNPRQVPGINDDVEIPAFAGDPVIQINSTASVRTVKSSEAITVNGGTFTFNRIDQLAGNFTLNGGTLAGGTFTTGALIVPVSGTTISGLTIAPNATFRLAANVRSTLALNATLQVNGSASFESASQLTFENRNNALNPGLTQIVVNGTMNTTGATFVQLNPTQNNSTPSRIVINSGGRLSASDSTFQVLALNWDYGALANATDLQRNRFDLPILIPADLVRFLSQQTGGSDNRRFGRVNIRGGSITSGNLTLALIGTETTQNLNYQFASDVQIATGAALIVRANVPVSLALGTTLTVNGTATMESGSVLTFENANNVSNPGPTQVVVNGSLIATNATFIPLNPAQVNSNISRVVTNSGGRLSASDSIFQVSAINWDFGALVGATDLQRNRFDSSLLLPAEILRFFSQQTGGSNNRRFGRINIRGGNFTSGNLTLDSIGTETTQNLSYQFSADLQIASGAALVVRTNVPVSLALGTTLTVNGTASMDSGSVLTFENANNVSNPGSTQVVVNGTLVTVDATFVPLNPAQVNSNITRVVINSGGRLSASDSNFQVSAINWDFGALVSATDLQRNRFDANLLLPANVLRFLSQPLGGSDNRRFGRINIRGENFASGNLTLALIGTETTQNLSYQFAADMQIASAAALIVRANVPVELTFGVALTVNGTATFEADSMVSFENRNSAGNTGATQIVVNGTMNALGAQFIRTNPTQTNSTATRIAVNSGATLNSVASTFPGIQQQHATNSNITVRTNDGRNVEFGPASPTNTLTEIDSFALSGGSTALVPASMRLAPSALFSVSDSSVYSTTGSLLVEPSSPLNFTPSGTFRFVGAGTNAAPQFLEAVSNDLGLTSAGFSSANYLFGTIEVGQNTWVRLTNQADNAPGATEAIYTNSLIVRSGATLDLMNFRLYTRAVYIEAGGRVINGDVEPVFRDGGNLVLGQPTPGKVDAVAQVDEWTFFARAGGSVALRLNPGSGAQPAAVAPQLSVGRVELVDPAGNRVAFANSPSAGALASISSIVLPLEGIYKVLVSAPPSAPLATGNYVITATDTTPDPRDTSIRIQSSRALNMQYGESVVFTTTVKPLAASGPNATGTVQFRINGVNFGTPLTLNNETASITVPLLQAGEHQVTVVYSGDVNNYNAKTSAVFNQVVNKVTLRFIAENKSKRAGEPLPTFTYLVNGFVNNETASVLSGQPSFSVLSQAINEAGTYSINITAGTLVAANYTFQFTNATLQVTPAAPAVLTALAGTPQSTKAGRRFASELRLRVEDAFGNRIPNAPVTFTAPSTGASGIFENNDRTITVTTGSLGLSLGHAATAALLSNETVGSYSVVASINGLNLNFQLTNNEQGPPLVMTFASDSIAERNGTVVATLRRNTPLGNPLTAVLTSANSQLVRVPSSVTFDSNSDLLQFNLTSVDNTVATGNLLVDITAASLTYSTTTPVLMIDDEEPRLNLLFSPLSIQEDGGVSVATITRNTPVERDMVVTLSTPDSPYIRFPNTVTIPAGSTSATFQVTAVDDGQVTGVRIVSLTASATGLLPSTRELELFDNDEPTLKLTLAANSVSENAGTTSVLLSRNTPTNVALPVNLATDRTARMQLPPTFVIPVGQASISIPISLIDDEVAGGNVVATISATARDTTSNKDYVPSSATLVITDNEVAALSLTSAVPAVVSEGGSAIELRVTRNTPTNAALPVTLSANKANQLSFPNQVEIPVGATSITFQVSGIDDRLLDGLQKVQLTADAGIQNGLIDIDVLDVVPLGLSLAAASIPERNGSVIATVSRPNSDISQPLDVRVSVSDARFVRTEATVRIPANQSQTTFTISAVDNDLLDGSRSVQITATAVGYKDATVDLQITDFEKLSLAFAVASISEQGGRTLATVRRPNSDTSLPVDVIVSSSSTQVEFAQSVRIEANQSQATFEIRALDNDLLDGLRSIPITVNATGYQAETAELGITDFEQLALTFAAASISERGGSTLGTVRRPNSDISLPLDVVVSSSSTEVEFAQTVRIEANQSQATFEISARDNDLLDGLRSIPITVNATGYQAQTADLGITDFEQLVITLNSSAISEFQGTTNGTVRRPNTNLSSDLVVQLTSSDTTEATVIGTVTILAGQASENFAVTAADDAVFDGTQSVAIAGAASGYVTGSTALSVTDQESLTLNILPTEISERNGTAKGTITRSDTGSLSELTVQLSSNDATNATFPATVQFSAGQASADFEIRATDNSLFNADRVVRFVVAAAGYDSSSADVKIVDDESLKPWRNPVNRLDVNGDGTVSPTDALLVINHLNKVGPGRLSLPWTGRFLDVNQDDSVSPVDALQVINFLNNKASAEGEEAAAADQQMLEFANESNLFSMSLMEDINSARRNRRR
ncbi:MAG: Ig-like domain repeat protein [Pirellulaceae bacterium]|nr:Ig-like domain repeat protein [Pirellulaceae bacterium]